ncbi:hypothetical protein [Nannocystis punicea]|uniref:Uncharacterized protein n=1 Tax=Nannocystis punicea TaxID=2995304 RepID=A0ABY7GV02_9BACT|nr:hypothetical protein [Nannocystis poenicansa]WAS90794.1 hypothetical protein O0S08_31790 [Nannocystis poenicansa]
MESTATGEISGYCDLPGGQNVGFTQDIDAAIFTAGQMYLFKDAWCVAGTPTSPQSVSFGLCEGISALWGLGYPYALGIQAATVLNDNVSFFRGDGWVMYNGSTGTLESLWPGVTDLDFGHDLDAVLSAPWGLLQS